MEIFRLRTAQVSGKLHEQLSCKLRTNGSNDIDLTNASQFEILFRLSAENSNLVLYVSLPLFQGTWLIAVSSVAFSTNVLSELSVPTDHIAIVTDCVVHETGPAGEENQVQIATATISRSSRPVPSRHLKVFSPPTFYEVTGRLPVLRVEIQDLWTSERSEVRLDVKVAFVFRRIQ